MYWPQRLLPAHGLGNEARQRLERAATAVPTEEFTLTLPEVTHAQWGGGAGPVEGRLGEKLTG